ncbi:MAG: dTDP-4-dehydrorhamnose 3,5-epimerase [Casimicrobiaceae bacterium]
MKPRSPGRKPALPTPDFLLDGKRDAQSITRDWQMLREPIAGVDVRETKNVLKDNGYLTEIWRDDWGLAPASVAQVFQALIEPRGISAWHVHVHATDRLFANHGRLKIVLYDARRDSVTAGRINVFHCGTARPMLISVPPGVWHGVQNVGAVPALLLNLPDRAYAYETPDHWRLPPDTDCIPYSFHQGAESQRGDSSGRF